MKYVKRIIAATAAATMLLSGCGTQPVQDTGDEQVTLKWMFLGPGEQQDSQKVWDKFNEELAKYLPNTKVEFECVTSSDYAEKWKLASASNEDLDIVWHGWMIPYTSEVKKGSYLELDDLIDEYAPDLKKEIPDAIMDKQRVDEKRDRIPYTRQI